MRSILRRRELLTDEWRYHSEIDTPEALISGAVIVPLVQFRANRDFWLQRAGALGVRLSPVDNVEELAPDVSRLGLVAAEFPGPADGRGFSQARILRTRLGFQGELRAIGAGVKQDLIFLMVRCGFDSFELAPGETVDSALRAYTRYTVAYQPGAPLETITQQRY
ncbi:MAG TPA: DUF934 domain-containing protein [Steroidobacteraceae bacterium]|jgi:uncharacterized protein (DUF934 family)